jgi:NADH-quinone oxidoreductase subunit B
VPDVQAAWESLPEPRRAIAFGACTISGGPYWDSYAVVPGVLDVLPGAVAIPGCPPRPDTLADALKLLLADVHP